MGLEVAAAFVGLVLLWIVADEVNRIKGRRRRAKARRRRPGYIEHDWRWPR